MNFVVIKILVPKTIDNKKNYCYNKFKLIFKDDKNKGLFMDSVILEKLFDKKTNEKDIDKKRLYEMINTICTSKQFEIFKEVMNNVKNEYFIEDNIHGLSHNERVAILAMFIAIKEGLADEDLKIVLKSAIYHDIGRKTNEKNHGKASADLLLEHKDEIAPEFDAVDLNVVRFLCESHTIDDREKSVLDKNMLEKYSLVESPTLVKMTKILKDADALDRVRLTRFGKIDTDYLRTDSAKEMVQIAKDLFTEYRNIQYDLGTISNTSIFDIQNDNIIEDENNYYVFRTLNEDNIRDLTNPQIPVIRTKGRVSKEDRGEETKFGTNSEISLEEIYSNIRVARSGKNNNCISFSTNANVSLDYGNERYIMYAIPKSGDSACYVAGKYMLDEINKKISKKLVTGNVSKEVRSLISRIDSETSSKNVKRLVGESFDSFTIRREMKSYTGKGDLISKEALISRFDSKQFFNEEQELEYDKIIAKLTVLETNGVLRSIISTQASNSNLISALGGAFSSSEIIHYGDIDKNRVVQVSKENLQLLALLQQAKNVPEIDKKTFNTLKQFVLDSIKLEQELVNPDSDSSSNDSSIDMSPDNIIDYLKIDEESRNIIPYSKGSLSLQYIYEYAKEKKKTYELIDGIRKKIEKAEIMDSNMDDLLDRLESSTIIPTASIISRRSNSGIQIAGTVNLDMNQNKNIKTFSDKEQYDLISTLRSLSKEDISQIADGDFNLVKSKRILSDNIVPKDYLGNPNEYYIDYILDSISLAEIYINNRVRIEKETQLREKIEIELKKVDIEKLYNAFVKAGVNYHDIPNYAINLVLEDGYENYTFEELVNSEELEQIISNNKNNFNYKITPFLIDKYLNVSDKDYHIPGTFMELKKYQKPVVEEVGRIFEKRNFAGVILPTGAGKSFVAMAYLLENPKQNILYFAPQEGILNQVQKHILKNILGKTILTIEDIDKMIEMSNEDRRKFLASKIYNPNVNITEELNNLRKATSEKERLSIKSKILPRSTEKNDDIMDAIHTIFPHLDMYCYQSLNGKEYQNLMKKKKGLMIFDELHRTGAETWRKLIKEMIEAQPDVKILGLTATPNRDDKNHTDMMKYMAENYGGFTKEEIEGTDYLAVEMYLTDAMQNKYIVEPKIVSFNFTLAETEQYKFVVESLREELEKSPNSELASELKKVKDEMDGIIYGGRKSKKENLSEIGPVLENVIPEKLRNGRFIVFLEHNAKNNELSSEEYMKQQIDLICQYFGGVNSDINADYLLSSRKRDDNLKAIQNFESLDNKQLKLLFAIDMLNEGVHVENINGELMLRPIGEGRNILYFQQIGRVIFGIDEKNPPKEEDIPIIFDVYNNYLTRDLDRTANITTPTSDLNNIRLASNWIKEHERMPDINSPQLDEARKAIILKKIQEKYEKYLDGIKNENLSVTEKRKIEKILEIAKILNLFEIDFGERIVPPGEKELSRVNAFEIKGDVKKFLELFKKSKEEIKKERGNVKISDSLRIRTAMSVFQMLNEYGVEISDDILTNLYRKINNNNKLSQESAKENVTLLELIDNSFSDLTRKKVIEELGMDSNELKEFKIYSEFDYTRQAFTSSKKKVRDIFSFYGIDEIRKTGILKENGKFISAINSRGFVLENGPEIFNRINIFTGTKFDESGYNLEGYDLDGYNIEGYDKTGYDKLGFKRGSDENKYYFRRDGINIITRVHFDRHGFDINGDYWAPDPEYPDDPSKRVNTHKNVNKYNFNRDGVWFKENEEGDLESAGYEDDKGFEAFKKVSKYKFRRDGYNIETESMYDKYGFDYNKINKDTGTEYNLNGFNIDRINEKTKMHIDLNHFDIDGYYYIYDNNLKIWENTYTFYNEQGLDINGWDVNGIDENGVAHFTEPVDKRGFNQKKIHVVTKSIIDENGLDYYGIYWAKENGQLVKKDSIYGLNGLTKDGINRRHFRVKDGWNVETNSYVDKNNWDINECYWIKNENGELVNSGSKYDSEGYNIEGINQYGFNRNKKAVFKVKKHDWSVHEDIEEIVEYDTNRYGFYFNLMHKNGTKYDYNGFDADGINKETGLSVNKYHFNRDKEYCIQNENGEWISTQTIYNPRGFSFDRRFKFGSYYDEEGFDIDYLDKHRFNKEHKYIDKDGKEHNLNPYDFGYDGFLYVFDEATGKYKKTDRRYGDDGFDIDDLNEEQFDRKHKYMHIEEYNNYGFNYKHIHKNGTPYDKYGFDYYGIHRVTKKVYNSNFFDRDGFFYKKDEATGKYIKTDSKINDRDFDIEGYWYKEDKKNKKVKTNRFHNLQGEDIYGVVNEKKIIDESVLKEVRRRKEEEKRRKEEEKRQREKIKIQEMEKRKKEARAREEAKTKAMADEKEAEKQKQRAKFDKDGICIATNLPYDEFYFDKDGINVITGTIVDFRGFKCTGECIRNDGLPYDRNGFKQDGTHIETGEKYYKGYNAYGVDKDGKTPSGYLNYKIKLAQEYIKANFDLKNAKNRTDFIKKYKTKYQKREVSEALKALNQDVFLACEMFPKVREELETEIEKTRLAVISCNNTLRKLNEEAKKNEQTIAKYQKVIDALNERINNLRPGMGEK